MNNAQNTQDMFAHTSITRLIKIVAKANNRPTPWDSQMDALCIDMANTGRCVAFGFIFEKQQDGSYLAR